MSDVTATVDTYFAVWNEEDAGRRAELIERGWATDGRYLDPLFAASGHGEISDMVASVHQQFPGHRFHKVRGIDAHHDQVRFAWELRASTGEVAAAGLDVAELSDDGRLRQVIGFLGDLPEAD
jgi:hypothetical protein